jgi:DNA end-binding protein Ku
MPRELWKGTINFGLVNIPVSLYPAEQREELSFTMLDKRDLSPIGYKRFNKNTGDEVPYERIVKGYEWEDGQYVLLEKEDFKRANVEATQSIDIVGFVDADAIPQYYYEAPYYLAPGKHGEKGYALLREVLEKSGRIGVANVVIRTRQHLAALYPQGNLLVLNTLRYQTEIRDAGDIKAPADTKAAKVQPREMQMAERLVEDMAMKWNPKEFHDTYRDDLLKLIEQKAEGKLKPAPKAHKEKASNVVDFASLLEKSLAARKKGAAKEEEGEEEGTHRTRRAAARTRRKAAPKPSHAHHRRAA